MNNILIFSTSVSSKEQINNIISPIFNKVAGIMQYTFDLEDSDRVLRIVGEDLIPANIELLLCGAGFSCQEMKYDLD